MNVYVIFEKDERFYNDMIFIKVVGSEVKAESIVKNKKDLIYKKYEVEL